MRTEGVDLASTFSEGILDQESNNGYRPYDTAHTNEFNSTNGFVEQKTVVASVEKQLQRA